MDYSILYILYYIALPYYANVCLMSNFKSEYYIQNNKIFEN